MAKKIEWHIEKRKLSDLKPHPKNPRDFTEKGMKDLSTSIDKIGMAQPINITLDNVVLSGHARLMTLQEKGVQEVDVYVPNRELSEKEQEEILIRMNANTAGKWDFDRLANEWESEDLTEWGLDIPVSFGDENAEETESKYTRKITIPTYEIKGEKPEISQMINTDKADVLISLIKSKNFTPEIEDFLIKTASRLYEFRYDNIAEFYAHQNKDVQEIMEKLALVIIDFDDAIKNGYVKLNKFIENVFLTENDIDE